MGVPVDRGSLETILQEELRRGEPPGLALGLVEGRDLSLTHTHGLSNVEANVPVNADTAFMMGSVTKLFTIIALMQQWEKGRFDLDDQVNRHPPAGKIMVKNGWPDVKFHHLLIHSGDIGELRRFHDVFHHGF